jgi:hypothetical protein
MTSRRQSACSLQLRQAEQFGKLHFLTQALYWERGRLARN